MTKYKSLEDLRFYTLTTKLNNIKHYFMFTVYDWSKTFKQKSCLSLSMENVLEIVYNLEGEEAENCEIRSYRLEFNETINT